MRHQRLSLDVALIGLVRRWNEDTLRSFGAQAVNMAKLYYIDHSLKSIGGHHYDSARVMLSASIEANLTTIVGAHRRFARRFECHPSSSGDQASDVTFCFLFRHTAYSAHSCTIGSTLIPADPFGAAVEASGTTSSNWLQSARSLWTRWRQERHLRSFVSACQELFRRVPPARGDHVFMPTLTEFDLVGVVEFLRNHAAARDCYWHLQFHYPIHYPILREGVADYADQSARALHMQSHFRTLAKRAGSVNWHFYAPTQGLVDQYNDLEVVPFELLEHPVAMSPSEARHSPDPQYQADVACKASRPMRALCAGALRMDKGAGILSQLIHDLRQDDFANGTIQLWVQAKRRSDLCRLAGDAEVVSLDDPNVNPPASARVVHVPHPLSEEAYRNLLRNSDAGLLSYDASSYAIRCSGVLVELLAAGTPVIVPARTWLAEELHSVSNPPPGLVASDAAEFAVRLRELAVEYAEFRKRAAAAPSYARRHSGAEVLQRLLSKEKSGPAFWPLSSAKQSGPIIRSRDNSVASKTRVEVGRDS